DSSQHQLFRVKRVCKRYVAKLNLVLERRHGFCDLRRRWLLGLEVHQLKQPPGGDVRLLQAGVYVPHLSNRMENAAQADRCRKENVRFELTIEDSSSAIQDKRRNSDHSQHFKCRIGSRIDQLDVRLGLGERSPLAFESPSLLILHRI